MSGKLNLVSVGPGYVEHITPAAIEAIKESDVIVGYELYLQWITALIADKKIHTTPLTEERERAAHAIELARCGHIVSLISSGDIGVYGMAPLAFDLLEETDTFPVRVVPGITAANACSSLLGSFLSHDFATLSLSDLLCPWETIEKKAKHLAQADMCIAFYNVQSKKRQAGIYKIIKILLEHKREDTVCGIVKNAYRPEQSVETLSLRELLSQQFDMFTTVLIGNRYTKRKGDYVFTLRGYNGWAGSAGIQSSRNPGSAGILPASAVWIFSGTSDGNELANIIKSRGHEVILSAATKYGGDLAEQNCGDAHILSGSIGASKRKELLQESRAKCVIDATHPYADRISQQLIETCNSLNIPYLRYERPASDLKTGSIICDSPEDAAKSALQLGNRIFLATGAKYLKRFVTVENAEKVLWFVRITPEPDNLRIALEMGIPQDRICAMQGPFSQAINETLWRNWNIDCVITKESGSVGGFEEKVLAAQALNIPMIVIKRPQLIYPVIVEEFEGVNQFVQALCR